MSGWNWPMSGADGLNKSDGLHRPSFRRPHVGHRSSVPKMVRFRHNENECGAKKTNATPQDDLDVAKERLYKAKKL